MKTTSTTDKPVSISEEEIRKATAELTGWRGRARFILPLTASERQEHRSVRIGPKSWRLVETRLQAARENRELLPPAFEFQKFEQDAILSSALRDCLAVIEGIREEVRATLLAVGSRAVPAGARAYAYLQVASGTSRRLERTVAKLALRTRRRTDEPAPARELSQGTETAAAERGNQ